LQLLTQLEGVAMATAALGHGTAGSDDATASWPDMATLRATAALLEPSARQRRGGKGLEQHGRMRARPAAVMATRWSHLRGELYLARKSDGGEVADVEEHTEVLWLGGIRPRRSVEVDFWLGGFSVPAELRRAEEAKEWRNGAASASGWRGVASRRG